MNPIIEGIYIKSYHPGLGKGGGHFVYDSTQSGVNDGGMTINGWKRQYTQVTPEMFGARGDSLLSPISIHYSTLASAQKVYPHVTDLSDSLDWVALQQAINIAKSVVIPEGQYQLGNKKLTIPPTLSMLEGIGGGSQLFSSASTAIGWDNQSRVLNIFIGNFLLHGTKVLNSVGLDITGFSYCTFENLQIRYFNDGVWGDGTVFDIPYNGQISNNLFNNVRSNNNVNAGFKLVGGGEANSANTFIGCEGAGNNYGFYEKQGYCNQSVNCCFQGNTIYDFYTDGNLGIHDIYIEEQPKSVKLDVNSHGNKISCRSSNPLWNTFIDLGMGNTVSVRGEYSEQLHIFNNPYFTDWVGAIPTNYEVNGAVNIDYFSDINIKNGGGLKVTFNDNFQGIILTGLDVNENLAGKWVTVEFEADTSGVTDLSDMRVYARDGNTLNTENGNYFIGSILKSKSGKYIKQTFDIKFPAVLTTTPNIIIYLAYSGITTINVIKFKSIKVVIGQWANVCEYVFDNFPLRATQVHLADPNSGINKAFKYGGKVIYNTTYGYPVIAKDDSASSPWITMMNTDIGSSSTFASINSSINNFNKYIGKLAVNNDNKKMYYAIGSGSADAWRATDGSGDITPV